MPISLVYRSDLAKLDGSDPLLLDAYGRWVLSPLLALRLRHHTTVLPSWTADYSY